MSKHITECQKRATELLKEAYLYMTDKQDVSRRKIAEVIWLNSNAESETEIYNALEKLRKIAQEGVKI